VRSKADKVTLIYRTKPKTKKWKEVKVKKGYAKKYRLLPATARFTFFSFVLYFVFSPDSEIK